MPSCGGLAFTSCGSLPPSRPTIRESTPSCCSTNRLRKRTRSKWATKTCTGTALVLAVPRAPGVRNRRRNCDDFTWRTRRTQKPIKTSSTGSRRTSSTKRAPVGP
uniref:(northern house mosquito) hypothetical protein n=1 Tax=Culex pipiens TaxID=7175 RepID=A0A8D8G383_CULPI